MSILKRILAISSILLASGLHSGAGEAATSTAWKPLHASSKIEIGSTTIKIDDKEVPAITARIPALKSSFSTALVIDIPETPNSPVDTISFRVKVPDGASRSAIVALFKNGWYLKGVNGKPVASLKFTDSSPEYIDNDLEVTWTVGPLLASAEEAHPFRIVFIYPTSELAEDASVTLTLSEVTFK